MPKTPTKAKTRLGKAAQARGVKKEAKREPLWKGPEEDGITQSLLSRFLVCRERFRLLVMEGLKPNDGFSHRMEYGNMWHVCEEAHAQGVDWEEPLRGYARELGARYALARDQITHWYNVCRVQFPVYVDYWKKRPDVKARTPLLQEQTFSIPYTLPSGRVVRLRGKWDSVDLAGKGNQAGIWLQENKAKGDIDEIQLQHQLTFDLQTMMYLVALQHAAYDEHPEVRDALDQRLSRQLGCPAWQKIIGVRYNVIRRPLSGGKGSIRKHQPTKSNPQGESDEEFYNRLANDYIKKEPEYFFMRWNVVVTSGDIERFKRECLNPILEQLCDWWNVMKTVSKYDWDPWSHVSSNTVHYRLPFGVYNPLLEGKATELDEYIATGSEAGLERVTNLFPEL